MKRITPGASRPESGRLTLLLVAVMLTPCLCLLWFMNQAMRNERLAARQTILEAYRAQLVLAREQLDSSWRATAANLDTQAESRPAPSFFAEQTRAGRVDAVVVLGASNEVVYPNRPTPPPAQPVTADWQEALAMEATQPDEAARRFGRLAESAAAPDTAARALQAPARCLARAGHREAALEVLRDKLGRDRFADALDPQGRLVALNAQLLALELMKEIQPGQIPPALGRLITRLKDYQQPRLAAGQRRFLMREILRLFPDQSNAFPTLHAEDLAAEVVESNFPNTPPAVLRAAPRPDLWQFTSARGGVLALCRTETVVRLLRSGLPPQALPETAVLAFIPPGKEAEKPLLTLPAGAAMPGWTLALSLKDQGLFETAASRRIASYVWIGALGVALAAILGLLALRLVRRQIALTQLRNDLVANVTHELKTPLSSMRLLVDTLLNSPRLDEATAREYLRLIARENTRLSRLIDNFLAFSRMERNKQTFDFAPTSAEAIVEAAAAAVRERFQVPGCDFQTRVPAGLPLVRADAPALVTALVNLLDNAFKYSGDEKRIRLSAGAENGGVFFAVEDNGIGLSPRETKRIFKRFYQVDQRLSRSAGGVGLGLSIVKFIVTAHHGEVRVESRPGQGSRFVILVPTTSSRKATPCEPPPTAGKAWRHCWPNLQICCCWT